MKTPAIDRLVRTYLLPELPGFAVYDGVLFEAPIEWLLKGFAFQPASWGETRVDVFVQPLYVPSDADAVALNYGERFGAWDMDVGGDHRAPVMAEILRAIQVQRLEFLSQIASPGDLAQHVARRPPSGRHDEETIAYSLVLAGDRARANRALQDLIESETNAPDPYAPDLSAAAAERAQQLQTALLADNESARELLTRWRDQTASAIGLTPFLVELQPT